MDLRHRKYIALATLGFSLAFAARRFSEALLVGQNFYWVGVAITILSAVGCVIAIAMLLMYCVGYEYVPAHQLATEEDEEE